jgi:hypothetical protein
MSGGDGHQRVPLAVPHMNRAGDLVQGRVPAAAEEAAILGGSLDAVAEGLYQRGREQFSDAWLLECPLIRLRPAPRSAFQGPLRSPRIGEPRAR